MSENDHRVFSIHRIHTDSTPSAPCAGFLAYNSLAMHSLTPSAAVQLIQFLFFNLSDFRPGAIITYYPATSQFVTMFFKAIILFLTMAALVNALDIRQSTNPHLVVLMPF